MDVKTAEAIAAGGLRHIAFIMDGNGRWAKVRGKTRNEGHRRGAEVFEKISEYCAEIGIRYVTVYAFSTENWKRPESEVSALMRLFSRYIDTALARLSEKKIRIVFLGDKSVFPEKLRQKMVSLEKRSSVYDRILNIAFNYGGRAEIVTACNMAIEKGASFLTEDDISGNLYTAGCPDPDLIVRTAGEMRLSNFLLWQAAYAEFYYTDTLWPDMTKEDVDAACVEFFKRKRRFGALPDDEKGGK